MMHWQGLTELTGASYTPLALVNADPAGVQVRSDAPYKSISDLLAAIKANPGKLKASGTGQGGIWHLALAGLFATRRSIRPPCLGFRAMVPRQDCRTWLPVVSISPPVRYPKRAR